MNVLYRFDDCVLDIARRELRRNDEVVALPGKVFECLRHLIEHRDRAVGRDELGHAAFGRIDVTDAHLGQVILRARRAVGDDGHEQRLIRTIPRYGFRWTAPTEVRSAPLLGDDAAPVGSPHAEPAHVERDAANDPPDPAAHALPAAPAIASIADSMCAGADTIAMSAPPANTPRRAFRTRPRLWWAVPLSAALAIGGAGMVVTRGTAPATASALSRAPSSALVMPVDVRGPEDAAWARLGLMAFVAERLRRGGLTVVPNESTLGLLGRAGPAPPDAHWLRQAANVDLVVDGHIVRDGGNWRLSVGAVDGHGIRRHGEARDADLLRAARIASDRLLAALGRHAPVTGEADLDLAERTQRAEAARLANELATARDILLSAPPAQRESPRLRYELAQVYTRAGDFAGAMALLTPLLADASVDADPAFVARVLVARGQVHMRQAQIGEAMRDFDAAVHLLDPDRHHAELGRALTYRGVTRSGLREFDAALADLGQARIHLLRAHDALAVARVDANLGVLELNRGRPAYAIDYLRKAAAVFESYGAVQELLITRSHVLQVHLMQLQYDQAWAASERDWAMRDRVRDPGQRLSLALDRAEILIRQGQFQRARTLLDDPALADAGALVNERRRAWVNIELAWRRGDARDALRRADAILQGWSEESWDNTRAWVLLRRQQAALALGATPLAMPPTTLDATAEAGIDRGSAVPEWLARAIALRAAGDVAGADALYARALSLAERRGIPSEIADAVSAYTPWLIARGRLAVAGSLVGRVGLWADRDYECALLQAQLYHALGHRDLWLSALETARHMAGERSIPAALTAIPRPRVVEMPDDLAVTHGNTRRK